MIAGQFISKAGLIQVHILDGGSSEGVEIVSLGELKYDFDLTPDSPQVDSVQTLYEKISIEILQHTVSGQDIYDRLLDSLEGKDGIQVNLIVGEQWTFRFFINLKDINLSESERTITLDCRVLYSSDKTILEVFDRIGQDEPGLFLPYLPNPNNEGEILDSVGILDWVEYAMKEVFLNDDPSVLLSAPSGLPQNYTQNNYTSFRGGIDEDRVTLLMARMESPPFMGYGEPQQGQGLILYVGDRLFEGSGFQAVLEPGYRLVGLRDTSGQDLGLELVIEEVISDSKLRVTSTIAISSPQYLTWQYENVYSTTGQSALEALQEIAAIEGAIFGTGFGRNFYLNRIQDQELVSVDFDDKVVDMDSETYQNEFGFMQLSHLPSYVAGWGNDGEPIENNDPDNFGIWPTSEGDWKLPKILQTTAHIGNREDISQSLQLGLAPGYPFLNKARWFSSDNYFVGTYHNIPNRWDLDFEPLMALTSVGLRSLFRALSGDGTSMKVEFELLGASTVKPWNLITFHNAPGKYTSKLFRPTALDYDFVNDTVSVEAYQIFEGDIPQPTLEIDVQGTSSSSGEVETLRVRGLLTTPEGDYLTTPEGDYLYAPIIRREEVSGSSFSSGQVEIDAQANFFRTVSGTSSSSGSVTTDQVRGKILTTPDGDYLTTATGDWLLAPVLIEMSTVSGQSSSSGSAETSIEKAQEAEGNSSSSGEANQFAFIRATEASGTSSSSGEVAYQVFETFEVQVSGTSSSSGSVDYNAGNSRPQNVSLSISGGLATVTWDQGALVPDNYEIEYDAGLDGNWAFIATVSGSTTSYEFSPCTFGDENEDSQARVRAVNPDSDWSTSNAETITGC